MKIFTWNVHGGYLSMFSMMHHDLYVPVKEQKQYNYDGKTIGYDWSIKSHEIKTSEISEVDYDIILFQTVQHLTEEQYISLTKRQRDKAKNVFIVHSPLAETDLNNPRLKEIEKLLFNNMEKIVHISQYTNDQWNKAMPSLKDKSIVIYHSIDQAFSIRAKYKRRKAVAAINELPSRIDSGRDVFLELKKHIDIDLYGKNSEQIGGLGNIDHAFLLYILSSYSIYCNPTIKNPLPMTVLEAMSIGLPVLALNTTDLSKAVDHGIDGFLVNTVEELIDRYRYLISNPNSIREMGNNAIDKIKNKFSPKRFKNDWDNMFQEII